MFATLVVSYFATAFNTDEGPAWKGWFERLLDNVFSCTVFITQEDKVTFVATTVYIIYYCLRVEASVKHPSVNTA